MRGKGEAEHERDIGFSGLLGCFFSLFHWDIFGFEIHKPKVYDSINISQFCHKL